jgi:hypothetical protein
MRLAEAPVKIELRGSATGGSGPDLTAYPHLTYAPHQWGEGVRIARNGAKVDDIAMHLRFFAQDVDTVAAAEELSWDELFDVLRYARANGAV